MASAVALTPHLDNDVKRASHGRGGGLDCVKVSMHPGPACFSVFSYEERAWVIEFFPLMHSLVNLLVKGMPRLSAVVRDEVSDSCKFVDFNGVNFRNRFERIMHVYQVFICLGVEIGDVLDVEVAGACKKKLA